MAGINNLSKVQRGVINPSLMSDKTIEHRISVPKKPEAAAVRKVDSPVGAYKDISKRRSSNTMRRGRANTILSGDEQSETLG